MGDPDFWRVLADKFRALDSEEGSLFFMWYPVEEEDGSQTIRHSINGGKRLRFEALARRAAKGSGVLTTETLLTAWVQRLTSVFSEGIEVLDACAASAEICSAL